MWGRIFPGWAWGCWGCFTFALEQKKGRVTNPSFYQPKISHEITLSTQGGQDEN